MSIKKLPYPSYFLSRVSWEDPVSAELPNQRMTAFSSPPPASGAVLGTILAILDQFNHTAADFQNPVTYHRFVEACKFGFAKRTLLGDWNDPDIRDVLVKKSLRTRNHCGQKLANL